jgi:Tfp pilus assembly protein PilE
MSDQPRDETGVTLIELLISVILLGIIIVPLTGAFIDGINSTTASQKRLSEARSPMFSNAYFAEDAQSADTITRASDSTTPTCGSGTNVISFAWNEAGTPYSVSYVLGTNATNTVLKRNYCKPSGSSTIVVAPVLGGNGACGQPACADYALDATNHPRTVSLTATTPNGENSFFTLTGTRRAT